MHEGLSVESLRDYLPMAIAWAVPFTALLYLLHAGKIPGLALRAAPGLREPPLWSWPEVLLTVICYVFAQIFFGISFQAIKDSGTLGDTGAFFLTTLASCLATVWVVYLLLHDQLGQSLGTLGLASSPLSNVATLICLYPITLFPLQVVTIVWQLAIFEWTQREPEPQDVVQVFQKALAEGRAVSVGLLVALGLVLAPITEEILFRGLILGWLRARWGVWVGAIVSAGLFSVVHLSLGAFLPLFALGLLLAYIAVRTGSIFCSMLYHALFNAVSFAVLLAKS